MSSLIIKIISVIMIFGFTSIGLSSNAFGEDGWQTSAQVTLHAKTFFDWDSKLYIKGERNDVWNNDGDHFYEHWEGIVGNVTPGDMFDYGVGYRYINNDEFTEHRPHVFVTPQGKFLGGRLKVSARNKLEYRIRDNGNSDGFRYALKPKVSYKIPATDDFSISPYLSDEIGYSTIIGDWDTNEVEVGFEFMIKEHYYLTPYYKYINDIPSSDVLSGDNNISMWGMNAGVSF